MTNTTDRATVVGVFKDKSNADRAIQALRDVGFRDDQIGVAMPQDSSLRDKDITTPDQGDETRSHTGVGSHTGTGAITGVLTGLGLGALAGLGVLSGFIPVIGPAIAGGTLGVIFSNAAAGAGLGGLIGALVGAGIPEEEATYYEGEFKAGRTIVTVKADGRSDEAMSILRHFGGYDVKRRGEIGARDERSASVISSGTMGSETEEVIAPATPIHGTAASDVGTPEYSRGASDVGTPEYSRGASDVGTCDIGDRGTEAEQHVRVKEEQLQAEKRPVEAGEVRVRKEARTEHQAIDVPVQREEVIIERQPGGGEPVSEDLEADDLDKGKEIRIPVRQEQVDVTKTPVVAEEVAVGKRAVQDTKRVEGEVRKEELHVDKEGDVDVKSGEPSDVKSSKRPKESR